MGIKLDPKGADARQMVKRFCNFVVHLKAIHRIGEELQSDEATHQLMNQTAPMFFTDINELLIEYFILASANITDRPRTFGKHENFTIANLLETIDWPKTVYKELSRLNGVTQDFHDSIIDARNKLLAHFDKSTFLSDTTLGKFAKGEDKRFIETLEEMCNLFHKSSFDCIHGDIVVSTPGDVLALRKALKRAVAFDKLFKESKGEEKQRLYQLLQS